MGYSPRPTIKISMFTAVPHNTLPVAKMNTCITITTRLPKVFCDKVSGLLQSRIADSSKKNLPGQSHRIEVGMQLQLKHKPSRPIQILYRLNHV